MQSTIDNFHNTVKGLQTKTNKHSQLEADVEVLRVELSSLHTNYEKLYNMNQISVSEKKKLEQSYEKDREMFLSQIDELKRQHASDYGSLSKRYVQAEQELNTFRNTAASREQIIQARDATIEQQTVEIMELKVQNNKMKTELKKLEDMRFAQFDKFHTLCVVFLNVFKCQTNC